MTLDVGSIHSGGAEVALGVETVEGAQDDGLGCGAATGEYRLDDRLLVLSSQWNCTPPGAEPGRAS